MKYLMKFNEMNQEDSNKVYLFNLDLNKILPDELSIEEYGSHTFKIGNIMKNSDMYQITYVNVKNEWGYTDTLEIDLYTVQDAVSGKVRFNVDITLGDFVVSEFSIETTTKEEIKSYGEKERGQIQLKSPNKIKVIQNMTYGTKFCKDCPLFSLTDESIEKLVEFFNHLDGVILSSYDLRFLNNRNDWKQT